MFKFGTDQLFFRIRGGVLDFVVRTTQNCHFLRRPLVKKKRSHHIARYFIILGHTGAVQQTSRLQDGTVGKYGPLSAPHPLERLYPTDCTVSQGIQYQLINWWYPLFLEHLICFCICIFSFNYFSSSSNNSIFCV